MNYRVNSGTTEAEGEGDPSLCPVKTSLTKLSVDISTLTNAGSFNASDFVYTKANQI